MAQTWGGIALGAGSREKAKEAGRGAFLYVLYFGNTGKLPTVIWIEIRLAC